MPAQSPPDRYPEGLAARRALVQAIQSARRVDGVTCTALIDGYDAAAGRAAARALEASLEAQVAATMPTPVALHAARRRVPSAKPCRMPGMRGKTARAELRSGRWERWTLDRILAVADGLGYEARIQLVKKSPATSG